MYLDGRQLAVYRTGDFFRFLTRSGHHGIQFFGTEFHGVHFFFGRYGTAEKRLLR